ncbi:hypothetical protein HY632_01340 [Candidatus Uhrbacteria bacterium]|nr:hypothetical protein [Candidatus Uhrbacteria bacterium]
MEELWKRSERNGGGTAKVVITASGALRGSDVASEANLQPGETGMMMQLMRRPDGRGTTLADPDAVRAAVAQFTDWALQMLGVMGPVFVPGMVVDVTDVKGRTRRGVVIEYAPKQGTIALEELRRPLWPFSLWSSIHRERVVLPLKDRTVRRVADLSGIEGLAAWVAVRETCPQAVEHVRSPELLARMLVRAIDMDARVHRAFAGRLTEVARNDHCAGYTPETLAVVAQHATDVAVCVQALERITDEATRASVAARLPDGAQRRAVVERLTRPDALLAFVLATEDVALAETVLARLADPAVFLRVARESLTEDVRSAAVAHITNQVDLLACALADEEVNVAAKDRLDALIAAQGIDAAISEESLTRYLCTWDGTPEAVRDAILDRITNDELLMEIVDDDDTSPDDALAALRRIKSTDLRIEIAEEHDDWELQWTALAGVHDVGRVLACAAVTESGSSLSEEAVRRLMELLKEHDPEVPLPGNDLVALIVDGAVDDVFRRELLALLTDESLLARVANEVEDKEIACAAVERISDQEELRRVFEQNADDDADVLCAIMARLQDLELLTNVASSDEWVDEVQEAAAERCAELVREQGWEAITNDDLLIAIAVVVDDQEMSGAAMGRVRDQEKLFALASDEDTDLDDAIAATRAITDPALLWRIADDVDVEDVCHVARELLRTRHSA